MTEPRVLCIMPYHRNQYLDQARKCFEGQTYANKVLFNWDTSGMDLKIGGIRNIMIASAKCDLIAHWDDDDWSAPERLTEQVAFMQTTSAQVVGYNDMAFMDETRDQVKFYKHPSRTWAIGTSLLYRRETWERVPFPDMQIGEDNSWLTAVGRHNVASCSSLVNGSPRMIARIHAGNTSPKKGARFAPADAAIDVTVRKLMEKL